MAKPVIRKTTRTTTISGRRASRHRKASNQLLGPRQTWAGFHLLLWAPAITKRAVAEPSGTLSVAASNDRACYKSTEANAIAEKFAWTYEKIHVRLRAQPPKGNYPAIVQDGQAERHARYHSIMAPRIKISQACFRLLSRATRRKDRSVPVET